MTIWNSDSKSGAYAHWQWIGLSISRFRLQLYFRIQLLQKLKPLLYHIINQNSRCQKCFLQSPTSWWYWPEWPEQKYRSYHQGKTFLKPSVTLLYIHLNWPQEAYLISLSSTHLKQIDHGHLQSLYQRWDQ
jgi:hypothetical protein